MPIKKRRVILPWVIASILALGVIAGGGWFWYSNSVAPLVQLQEKYEQVAEETTPPKPTLRPDQEHILAVKKVETIEEQIQKISDIFFDIMTKLITMLGSIAGLIITFLTIKEKTKALKRREPTHAS